MSGITGEQYEGVYIGVSRVTVSSSVETIGYNQYGINDGTGECLVDDDMYDSTQVTVGQTMDIVGICHYSYDHYKVFPRTAQDIRPYGTSNSKKSWGRIKSIYR
jgi:predicted metallo-beta-lactamase superfamily hydrolase